MDTTNADSDDVQGKVFQKSFRKSQYDKILLIQNDLALSLKCHISAKVLSTREKNNFLNEMMEEAGKRVSYSQLKTLEEKNYKSSIFQRFRGFLVTWKQIFIKLWLIKCDLIKIS